MRFLFLGVSSSLVSLLVLATSGSCLPLKASHDPKLLMGGNWTTCEFDMACCAARETGGCSNLKPGEVRGLVGSNISKPGVDGVEGWFGAIRAGNGDGSVRRE